MALQQIDILLDIINNYQQDENHDDDDDDDINLFESLPMSTLIKIWSYLISTTPLTDNLVLTSKLFRNITYNHPLILNSFHLRLDPSFKFNKFNHNKFQIGSNITISTLKSVIINNICNIKIFPFHQLKVVNITEMSSKQQVIPFLNLFCKNIKCMTWNINNFDIDDEKQEDEIAIVDDEIPIFEQCELFALATCGKWSHSIELKDKFKKLTWFNFALDDYRIKWDKDIFDKLQSFLFSVENTLSIFVFDLNLKKISVNNDFNIDKELIIIIPKNIEILVLNCMDRKRGEMIKFDFSQCRKKLKQIVLLNNSLQFVINGNLFNKDNGACNLKYFVINDRNDVNQLTNNLIIENPNLFKNTKIKEIYAPCIPKLSYSNDQLSSKEINGIQCIDSFPYLQSVKDIIQNHNVRKLFRNLNCEERRHWLWCIFWFDINGKGLKNLHQLESKWKLDDKN